MKAYAVGNKLFLREEHALLEEDEYNIPMHEYQVELRELVDSYFSYRGLVVPNADDAFLFLMSEVGELADAIVHSRENWVRNNPSSKHGDIEGEAGDVLMMLICFCNAMGIDPVECMVNKFKSKGWHK